MAKPHFKKIKDKKKKKLKHREKIINNFRSKINKQNNTIWYPKWDAEYQEINTNSCFNIQSTVSPVVNDFKLTKNTDQVHAQYIKCKTVIMDLTSDQKLLMDRWFNSYALMYNQTLKFIKETYHKEKKTKVNFRNLRSLDLMKEKEEIIKNCHKSKKKRVMCHNLDGAIKLACANYKSALTNLKRGHIKTFRIRYWKLNRNKKIMDMEHQYFNNNAMCLSAFGKIKYYYNGQEFDITTVNKSCKIGYSDGKYYLYVPEELDCEQVVNAKKIFSGDPGIKTFLTGISENEAVKIGDNFGKQIEAILNRMDNLNKRFLPKKIHQRYNRICSERITNLVDELHWKTINYLTKNYNTILIGDMSVKGITNKQASKLTAMTKRIGYRMKFYTFRQRLEYKCKSRNLEYKKVDESFTSKMCSRCGNVKEDLGGNRIYNCTVCGLKIDRDINGARGIYLKYV